MDDQVFGTRNTQNLGISSVSPTSSSDSLRSNLIDMKVTSSAQGEMIGVKRQSYLVTAVLLCNSMVGSGVLNQGQVFSDAGIIATTFLYAVSVATMWLGGVLLIDAADALGLEGARLDFSVLATVTHGKMGGQSVDISIAILNFSANLSYILLIGSLSSTLLQSWTGNIDSPLTQPYFLTPLLTAIFIFPTCLAHHFTSLPSFAFMCLTCALLIMLVVMLYGPVEGAEARETDDSEILWWDWGQLCRKAGSVIFALSFTPAAFHAYIGLQPRTPTVWKKSMTIALFSGACICYITGLIGYLSFRSDTDGNILDNFYGTLAEATSVLLILHLIWYTPMEFIILRHSLLQLFGMGPLSASRKVIWSTTAVLLTLMTITCVIFDVSSVDSGDAFGVIVDLAGGVGGSILCFILPALTYKRAFPEGYWSKTCTLLAVFGIFVAIAVPVSTMRDFINGDS